MARALPGASRSANATKAVPRPVPAGRADRDLLAAGAMEASQHALNDETPAIDQNEHQELDWKGDAGRRNHHHPERQKNARDYEIDHQEWQKDHESDGE